MMENHNPSVGRSALPPAEAFDKADQRSLFGHATSA